MRGFKQCHLCLLTKNQCITLFLQLCSINHYRILNCKTITLKTFLDIKKHRVSVEGLLDYQLRRVSQDGVCVLKLNKLYFVFQELI